MPEYSPGLPFPDYHQSMLVLEVIDGVDQGQVFPLPMGEPQLIGRSSESLPLSDQSVSRRHAELTPDGDRWWLRDLQSANGTWVNGRRVDGRVELRQGDEVTCGETTLRLNWADRLISGPSAAAQAPEVPPLGTVALSDRSSEAPETLEAAQQRLRMLETLSSLAVSTSSSTELMEHAIELLVKEFSPKTAVMLMTSQGDSSLDCVTRRGGVRSWNQAVADRVQKTARPLLAVDVIADLRFADQKDVEELGTGSVMGAPLQIAGQVFGVILLEDQDQTHVWDEADIRLLSAVSKQVSLAIVNANVPADQLRQTRLASMGETVATISHAVKNIMQGLRGGAGALELALSRGDLDLANEAWPILARNLDRIHDLTFNMLAWSRSGALELEMIQVGPIVQEAIDLLETQCRHRKVKIILEGEDDLPPVPVDSSALHQAIMNLLTNAIEAVPSKTGLIKVTLSTDKHCQWLSCSVADNGEGVDPSRKSEIFQPFTSTKGQRGTGLGLAVTRKIALDHGGSLELDSSSGSGARFLLRLPMARDGDPGDTDTPRAASSTRTELEFDD